MKSSVFSLKGHGSREYGVVESVARLSGDGNRCIGALQVAAQAWPFGLAGLFHLIYFQVNIVLLRYLDSAEAAGYYNVAFVALAAVYLFPSVLYQKFVIPKFHRWAYQDRPRLYRIYKIGNSAMFFIGLAVMVAVWLISPWAVPRTFGVAYEPAVSVLMLLSVCIPVRFLATSMGATLVTQEHMQRKVRYMGCVAGLNVVLNVILIPVYSLTGAALATIASELVLLALYASANWRYVFGNPADQ